MGSLYQVPVELSPESLSYVMVMRHWRFMIAGSRLYLYSFSGSIEPA
jgi:hypothetical protein